MAWTYPEILAYDLDLQIRVDDAKPLHWQANEQWVVES